MDARRPLAKVVDLPPMESRDERLTMRLTSSQLLMFAKAAREAGVEVSRYVRDCAVMGHTVRQAQAVLKATGA